MCALCYGRPADVTPMPAGSASSIGVRSARTIPTGYRPSCVQSATRSAIMMVEYPPIASTDLDDFRLLATFDTDGEVIFGRIASLHTSWLNRCRARLRAQFRLRHQYHIW